MSTISKKDVERAVRAGSVALATVGLTTCDYGAVDPAPPPLQCSAAVGAGDTLVVTNATVAGTQLSAEIGHQGVASAWWDALPVVTNVVGGALVSVVVQDGYPAVVTIDLGAATGSGSFTLAGTLTDGTNTCAVSRTFDFEVTAQGATVAEVVLPLGDRRPAGIVVVRREDHEVELGAAGSGPAKLTWAATGGTLTADGERARWRLPKEPGLYQVELVVERESGLAVDTLTLEVS